MGLNPIFTTQLAPAARVLAQVFEAIRKFPAPVPRIEKPVKLRLTDPVLLTVTDRAALLVPTVTVPKLSEDGKTETIVPVPLMFSNCGLPPPSSANLRLALRVPVPSGLNEMPIAQLAPPASVVPQVSAVIRKSPGLSPTIPILVKVTVAALTLVTVMVRWGLVVPTVTVPNFREVGVSLIAVPVPTRLTTCGLGDALSVNVKFPFRVPFAVGVKVTLTAQLAPVATVAPQVLLEMAKSPLAVILEILSVAVPVLVSLTRLGLVVTPMTVLIKLSLATESVTVGVPAAAQPAKAKLPMCVLQLNVPLTFSY